MKYFIGCLLIWGLISGSVLAEQPTGEKKLWVMEDESGKAQLKEQGDTLEIVAPGGLTLWYNQKLSGNYEISYAAMVCMQGHAEDRLSDLNCFWAAKDPFFPQDLFARADWRKGIFARYNTLNLYYVGYGGNENTTTRFRKYHGEFYGTEVNRIKPLIAEYTDPENLLQANVWKQFKIQVTGNRITYSCDGKVLFDYTDPDIYAAGYFGIRLLQNHVFIAHLNVTPEGK